MMIPATNVTTTTYHSVPQLVSFDEVLSKSEKSYVMSMSKSLSTLQSGPSYAVFDSDRLFWYLSC